MEGSSGTPLRRTLGNKPGHRLALLGEPDRGVETRAPDHPPEVVDLLRELRGTKPSGGILPIVPKVAAMHARFAEAPARLTPACGLVGVKICAIDDRWPGPNFVRRVRDR